MATLTGCSIESHRLLVSTDPEIIIPIDSITELGPFNGAGTRFDIRIGTRRHRVLANTAVEAADLFEEILTRGN